LASSLCRIWGARSGKARNSVKAFRPSSATSGRAARSKLKAQAGALSMSGRMIFCASGYLPGFDAQPGHDVAAGPADHELYVLSGEVAQDVHGPSGFLHPWGR